jgi:hypothetical protein
MAKRENISTFARKGKPSSSEKDLDNLDQINEELDDVTNDIDTDEAELKHPNRHLHKGEELATFKDREDDDDEV